MFTSEKYNVKVNLHLHGELDPANLNLKIKKINTLSQVEIDTKSKSRSCIAYKAWLGKEF